MDPDATIQAIQDLLDSRVRKAACRTEAGVLAKDVQDWIDKGGFTPKKKLRVYSETIAKILPAYLRAYIKRGTPTTTYYLGCNWSVAYAVDGWYELTPIRSDC